MLKSGVAMLQRHGIEIGVDGLTLEAVCLDQDIARSSSHAAWAIDDQFSPQETFQRAVLQLWLRETEGTLFAQAASESIAEVLSDDPDNLPLAFQRGAESAFLEGVKRYEAGEGDFISTDMAMRFAVASQREEERDEDVFRWIQESEARNRHDRINDLYKPLGELLGVSPKPGLGEDAYQFYAMVVAALLEGFTLRRYLSPEFDCLRTIGPAEEGGYDESVIAACVKALIPVFFEPNSETKTKTESDAS